MTRFPQCDEWGNPPPYDYTIPPEVRLADAAELIANFKPTPGSITDIHQPHWFISHFEGDARGGRADNDMRGD